MSRNELVTVDDCQVVATSTGKAVLVHHQDWEEDLWFPDSQIDDDSEIYSGSNRGDTGKLVVTEWIAKQKGIAQ